MVVLSKGYEGLNDKQKWSQLSKVRNFIGQTPEERISLEEKIKSRYDIEDWQDSNSPEGTNGYKIHDNRTNEDLYFSANARITLETRYLEKDVSKNVSENALDLFARVAVNVAEADLKYNSDADVKETATTFLEMLINKEFMPNTPTLCNAGRALQQLSACFVLPVDDYLATDDIGDDPEKQGNGIYDTLRYMAMVHKSGGGTGFNFSDLRPRTDRISTTFGSSSGPVSFIKVYDASTDAVNQGGFRRGANMGILEYWHPDIFEFISEKARTGGITNFNLSVGYDDEFMEKVENDNYFKLVNPKNKDNVSLEERVWTVKNLLRKGEVNFDNDFKEFNPSLIVSEDGKEIINVYNEDVVGRVDVDGTILISAKKVFDYVVDCAWADGCPGMIHVGRLKEQNMTPNAGEVRATNPCGEQPLPPFGACNLGAVNLATCVRDGELDYSELDKRINQGVHFLDNVIDMSKFPFQKVYESVHATRRIGLGMMGFAEVLSQMNMAYGSEESKEFAAHISTYITEKGREKSVELAKDRGVFPFWEGSKYEEQGIELRNGTITTIAPNGTTGMIADANGGIEPYFKVALKKTCMDGKELIYWANGLREELQKNYESTSMSLEKLLEEVQRAGTIQHIDGLPDNLKKRYLTSHDITPSEHIEMQSAFQIGSKNVGVDNAVSKTVNLPNEATLEDVARIYLMSYKSGAIGTTVFRDGSKTGVYSSLEDVVGTDVIKLIHNDVKPSPILDTKAQAMKYRIKRPVTGDSLHITFTSDLFVDDKNKKSYFLPMEVFQERAPLGDARSVSFAQAGMDRTEILQGPNPNYSELVVRLQSASSNEEEGLGPKRVKSSEHAVGIAMEDLLLRNGIIGRDENTNRLVNVVNKSDLRHVEVDSDEYESLMKQVRARSSDEKQVVMGTNGKIGRRFVCESCNCTEYTFEAGCHHPKCSKCGEIEGGGCS
ncbi:adenosylcobalamin-dependent ribonucleoside-diphosphate reductase [archaeon]|nr:adenosylcobalamin-dependent ribonucleoside-diphosphate reductase [archaeon]